MPFAVSTSTRRVGAGVATVRAALATALRGLGYEVTAEQVTLLEARRGSQLAAAALQVKRLPVLVSIQLRGLEGGTTVVDIRVTDGWQSGAGRALGLSRSYAEVFAELAGRLDDALRALDPALDVPPPQVVGAGPGPGLLDRVTARGSGAGGGVARVEGWLEGRSAARPEAWRSVAGVRLVSSEGEARLGLERVQAMLTVALLVNRTPGSMPERLATDVERFAARLEGALTGPGAGSPRLDVTAEELPVVRFLWEQARIREALPLRTLQRCTTCRHEKVVNPDYKRLAERNRKIRGVGGAVGASFSPAAGASPFFLVGRLLPLAKLDPEYVCPRCQGLESDDRVIVFCPTCGERRDEAVLKTCRRCSHDFRRALEPEPLWREPEPEPNLLPPGRAPLGGLPPPMGPPQFALPPPNGVPQSALPPPNGVPQSALPPPQGTPHVALPPPKGTPVAARPAPVAARPAEPARPAAWLPDPSGRHEARWWDGGRWTDSVLDAGRLSRDGSP